MLRCVVIGCGWAGIRHINTIVKSPLARLAALVEPDAARAKEVADTHGVPVYHSLDALLGSGLEFEAGVVATLPELHRAQCIALANACKHILCEKPVCRSSKDIEEVAQAVCDNGVRFGAVFNQRYGAAVQKAKALIEEDGTAVSLITASMYQHAKAFLNGQIREDFLITDACCHLLDLVTYLGGPVRGVRGMAKKADGGIYSDVAALLDFEYGGIGVISHTSVGGKLNTQHPFQCIDIHTSRARYKIENHCDRLTVYPHENEAQIVYETSVFLARDYDVSLRAACNAFLQAIYEGGEPPAGIEDALSNMRILESITHSITC